MKKNFLPAFSLVLFLSNNLLSQNVFPTGVGTYAGIGITSNVATALHVRYDNASFTANSASNFITIDNRGTGGNGSTGYATSHVIGGLLFGGYRDVRNPSFVAGIWANRNPSTVGGNLNSQGDLIFGTTNDPRNFSATDISANSTLPAERMRITSTGNVGIGTASPSQLLQVNGTTLTNKLYVGSVDNTHAGSYLVAVNGDGIFQKLVVKLYANWPDYVFNPKYKLMPLSSVAEYINKYRHLPDLSSTEEMQKKDGQDLGEMNLKLLQKVEELTLYLIELKKENDKMKEQISTIEKKLDNASN